MEPDTSAISSPPLTDSEVSPGADEPVRPGVAEPGFPAAVVTVGARSAGGRGASSNGHANGHGHAPVNGNGRAHPATEALPSVAGWRALVGPVNASMAGGAYAPSPSLSVPARAKDPYLRFGKRALDLAGAVVGLVITAPLVLLAAIAIKLESRGPVLYRSTRVGRGGRPFTFFKLRSMVNGADRHRHHLSHLNECDGPVFKISRDPRVTAVGRFLRTTSLDELPQLWNVLRGDMSLVGPRPPLPEEVSHYQPWQMRRLDVRPGLTCLWQISGRSRIGFEEWMRLDLEYISRRSLRLDLQILVRTIPAVISREGAY